MKNTITTFALVLAAFVAVNLLMSFAKPIASDEPKEYILVRSMGDNEDNFAKLLNKRELWIRLR
jgi:hypothetical protein